MYKFWTVWNSTRNRGKDFTSYSKISNLKMKQKAPHGPNIDRPKGICIRLIMFQAREPMKTIRNFYLQIDISSKVMINRGNLNHWQKEALLEGWNNKKCMK